MNQRGTYHRAPNSQPEVGGNPPPIPPRTLLSHPNYNVFSEGQGYFKRSNSYQPGNQFLMSLSPPSGNGAPCLTSAMMDLEGIDFSMSSNVTADPNSIRHSASMEDVTKASKKVYPDISKLFHEVKQPQGLTPSTGYQPYTDWNSRQQTNKNSVPPAYGWDPAFTGMSAGANLTSSSVPTTPIHQQMFSQHVTPGNFPAPAPCVGYMGGSLKGSDKQSATRSDISDTTKPSTVMELGPWPNVPGGPAPRQGNGGLSPWGTADKTFLDEAGENQDNKNLIELGFEGILTSGEKEYFSLEYFDPLHRKGRTDSFSAKDGYPIYSFAKPPDEKSTSISGIVSSQTSSWVTFDEDSAFLPNEPIPPELPEKKSRSLDRSKSQKGVDVADTYQLEDVSKAHEKLRKKIFVDDESDSFCQMVAELKGEFKSTNEKTNLGFIVSPMCDKQQEDMTVKMVVHSDFVDEPFSFTSDVHSFVEHIISHVVYVCLSDALPSHMMEMLKTVDFILKIHDRSEYLLNEDKLSQYSYTHDCLKMGLDLCFHVMRRQDVALPFLRTVDDDQQHLYFPQDHVKDTEVTRESLEILMDTFYKEEEKVNDMVLKDEVEKVQFQSISQSVKAICNVLSKIETIDINKALSQVESILAQLKESVQMQHSSNTLEHQGGGYATIQRKSSIAAKCSLVPALEESLDALVNAVKLLVRIYCQAFHTDFHLGSRIDQPWDPQDVIKLNENFIVQICSVHRIPAAWSGKFDEYKIVSCLYHGKRKLSLDISTTCASINTSGLVARIVWDEWSSFEDVSLCLLPRETRLCITLVGLKSLQSSNANNAESQKVQTALGGVTIQLFNRKGYMLQGSQLVPLQMNKAADPVTPFCSTLQPDSVLLQLNLLDFGKQVIFSDPLNMPDIKKRPFQDLAPEIQEQVKEVMKKDCVQSCSADQLEILWSYRNFLHEFPNLLPWILQAAQSWDWGCLPVIYILLKEWTTLHPMQSLELLLPQYPDVKVRGFAVDCLRKMPTDDLIDFIPQLIQALKYESYHSSPLARLLLEQACKSVRFAHQFFWLLKGATQDVLYKRRYELMFVALANVAGEALYQEFKKQEDIIKTLTFTAEQVQGSKDKEAVLRKNLETLQDKFSDVKHILLPHNPGYEVSGLELNSCAYFPSNALPLKLVFMNRTSSVSPVYAMFKVGDDLRQDMMTMQIIRIMDRLWLKEGLDLKMVTFNCLPTGPRRGFIELITESETLRKIQVSSGVTGSFKDRPIKEWLQKHNPTELEYQKAVENFSHSCAGYCVATYVLGVCDRHNDNIMLKQSGHMFHIDFNKFLGDSQMFGSIKRDRVKFVLTSDMAYVINDGYQSSVRYQHFVDICCQAFNIIRKHANLFINLFSLMLRSAIPGITEKGIEFIQRVLLPGLTNTQASAEFTRMIEESLSAKSTQLNFFIHNLAQMKFVNHNEGTLLSFVPKTYNQQTDGRIKQVEIVGLQKRYQPEKHYIYTLKIEREQQKIPSYVFRTFDEFSEFHSKLADRFRLISWSPLSGRVILGRSHVKAVAENRKTELERFLHELFSASPEVSHCELVYTFFHPLLRDEQEAQKERLGFSKLRENQVTLNRRQDGQVKLSVEYIKGCLHIMIMHAKDLPVPGSELPSPYVKTYLLPDPEKQTKKKTKVVKHNTNPTYNEVIEYKITLDSCKKKTLQVTIWDHDVLKENNFLGAVYIKLCDLDLGDSQAADKDQGKWYKLQKIQITDPSMIS